MITTKSMILTMSILMLTLGSVCFAESNNDQSLTEPTGGQSLNNEQMYAQIQTLQTQLNQVNSRVTSLEEYKKSNLELMKTMDFSEDAKVRGRGNHPDEH